MNAFPARFDDSLVLIDEAPHAVCYRNVSDDFCRALALWPNEAVECEAEGGLCCFHDSALGKM